MNMAITLILILTGFTMAMLGVIVLFSVDVWIGFALAAVGIGAAISSTMLDQT